MARRSSATQEQVSLAEQADRHALYQLAVNAPIAHIEFIRKVYRSMRKREPRVLKEDFCGTALMAATWAQRSPHNRAIGVDLDAEALAWGRRHNLERTTHNNTHDPARNHDLTRRVTLVHADVLEDSSHRADIVCALNFSYNLLLARHQLLAYLANARRNLLPGGLFLLDCIGGTEAVIDFSEERRCHDFTYIWSQQGFNPLDHSAECSISFAFPDGSRLEPAFAYRWRLWTMPELRDCLAEAGFTGLRIFWEYSTDAGDARHVEIDREQNQEIWLAYVVAW
jgi:SAM-dependent methyltransferase